MANERRVLSAKEVFAIGRIIEPVITCLGDGLARYNEGYDDNKIAEMAGNGYTDDQVASVRERLFGKLEKKTKGPKASGGNSTKDRLLALEVSVVNLAEQNSRLIADLTALVEKVAANSAEIDNIWAELDAEQAKPEA